MKRTLSPLLAVLLFACASAQTNDQPPRAEGISACWTKFGGTVSEQTTAALAQRKCEQACEPTPQTEALADGGTGTTEEPAVSETDQPRMCERECDAPSEAEEIEIAAAAWLQTSAECHEHAQVLARRTRVERQQEETASRQQDWSSASPEARAEAELAEFRAQLEARKNESTSGEIVVKERMGKKSVVLQNLVAPVIREQDYSAVYTVELLMVLFEGSAEISISAHYRHEKEWAWLKCHDVGLWKSDPWTSAPNVAGSDGNWTHVKAEHGGDVGGDSLSEWVMFNVPLETLRELAAAEHSGGQVCNHKFELSAAQKITIASFTGHPGHTDI